MEGQDCIVLGRLLNSLRIMFLIPGMFPNHHPWVDFVYWGYVLRLLAMSQADRFYGCFDLLDLRAMQSLRMGHAPGVSTCSRSHKGLIDAAYELASVCAPKEDSSSLAGEWMEEEYTGPMSYWLLVSGGPHISKKG